jgi:hypothetical protein
MNLRNCARNRVLRAAGAVSPLFLLLPVFIAPAAAAPSCSKLSPPHTVALLELYTSEGCDSCPPADRFVSGLRNAGLDSEQVVPLSLHVDYWDYIGWKDAYARRTFTDRQRWRVALANGRAVYTPEIFIAGREVRDWAAPQRVAGQVQVVNARPARADIRLTLGQATQSGLPAEVSVKAAPGGALFLALYENGLSTDVKAGENRGVTLKHDYVVRDWIGPVPVAADAKGARAALPRMLALPEEAPRGNLGVAAFIQDDRGEVLQAVSMPLCNP